MFERLVERRARETLADTPVVLIVGPRRAGKTTLVRKMGTATRTYVTLDDRTALEAAQSDPVGFIRGMDQAIIDEVQRAPDLLLAIKKAVDEDYRPGRFLLTGSANVLTLPRVADSLAGRMETIHMLPLARAEVAGQTPSFLERLFEGTLQNQPDAIVGDELVQLVLLGGFPEAISRDSERRRQDWLRSYLTSILTRDLRDIADVEKLTELPKFVRLLAEHSGQLVNYSQLTIPHKFHLPQSFGSLTAKAKYLLKNRKPRLKSEQRERAFFLMPGSAAMRLLPQARRKPPSTSLSP